MLLDGAVFADKCHILDSSLSTDQPIERSARPAKLPGSGSNEGTCGLASCRLAN
jgi:hypothetical protein